MMESPNPAVWTGNLSALLPSKTSANRRNHPALQLKDAHRWWEELKQRDGLGTLALMMLTLTASRSGEIRGMQWDEISLFDEPKAKERGYLGIWTRPAERMKAKREHRVPIIQPMYDLIFQANKRSGLVFKSRNQTALSDMTLSALMKRMHFKDKDGLDERSKLPAVPHGLRSTFRNWVAETGQSREAAELQLAHKFGSNVEHAYYRTDLIDERAKLLMRWYEFLEDKVAKKQIRGLFDYLALKEGEDWGFSPQSENHMFGMGLGASKDAIRWAYKGYMLEIRENMDSFKKKVGRKRSQNTGA